MKTLTIRLTAPLQSFGNQANFNRRTSNYYPTKSAILGMIAAAFGWKRNDLKIASLNDLKFATRIDQPGKFLTDYQIVEYQKSSKKFDRKETYRDYLQDAVFMVAIGSEDEKFIDDIEIALCHPKFQLYLGRRSNPPAGLLETELFPKKNPVEVLTNLEWKASNWYQKRFKKKQYKAKIIADADLISDSSVELFKDKIGSLSNKDRFYQYRPISTKYVMLSNKNYSSEHDAFSALGKV